MPSTAIDRRRGLAWLLSGLTLPLLMGGKPRPAAAGLPLFVSARGDRDGYTFVTGFDAGGTLRFDIALPGRGHAAIHRPGSDELVILARRPGTFALVIDLSRGVVTGRLRSGEGRHFYGHGAFSPDGRRFFTTENEYDRGRGVIGVRDATLAYAQVGEFPSYEVGPHDLRLLSDGSTLAVANGGILTHPDSGRAKLNLAEMSPALTYVDSRDGVLQGRFRLPRELRQLSIRHLALGPGDRVALAMQYQGPRGDLVPLVGIHRGNEQIALLPAGEAILRGMRHYCGGGAFDASGEVLAISCPRGNLITFWHAGRRRFLDSLEVADGCGVAGTQTAGRFLITSGAGAIYRYDLSTRNRASIDLRPLTQRHWDNHLTAILRGR